MISFISCICPFTAPLLLFKPLRLQPAGLLSSPALLPPSPLAGSGLQDGLKLPGHADVLLLLTDNALDGGRQASGIPGEDQGVAVLAASIVLQGAAGVGDGVVVVVGVDHPVVVTWWMERRESLRRRTEEV